MEEKAKNFRFFLIFTEKSRKKRSKKKTKRRITGIVFFVISNDIYAKSIAAAAIRKGNYLLSGIYFRTVSSMRVLNSNNSAVFPIKIFSS